MADENKVPPTPDTTPAPIDLTPAYGDTGGVVRPASGTPTMSALKPAPAEEPIDPETGLSVSQLGETNESTRQLAKTGGRLSQADIEKTPGLQPEQVQQLQEAGLDTLGSVFGKEKGDYVREHILHGFSPEVTARAAEESLTDWYSPAMLALSAPGRIAHGYAATSRALEEAGSHAEAIAAAGKARLAGLLGTAIGVPLVASQVHNTVENWDKMSPAERTAAVSGILRPAR